MQTTLKIRVLIKKSHALPSVSETLLFPDTQLIDEGEVMTSFETACVEGTIICSSTPKKGDFTKKLPLLLFKTMSRM